MITIHDWNMMCEDGGGMFYHRNGDIHAISPSAFISYDKTMECYRTANDVFFTDMYNTREDCAEAMIRDLSMRYLGGKYEKCSCNS